MRRLLVAFAAALSAACAGSAIGGGTNSVTTPHRFDALLERIARELDATLASIVNDAAGG